MNSPHYHQIADYKKRRGPHRRFALELVYEIQALSYNLSSITKLSPIFVEFIPIRLVTIMEVYLRGLIAELVDSREDFFQRGEKLVKGAKIDLNFVAFTNRRELSIGDFIAHSVSLNSINSIISVLDTLFGDFVQKLKVAHSRWSEDAADWPLPPIIDDFGVTVGSLAHLFDVRHVLTHELPREPALEIGEVPGFIDSVAKFIEATDWMAVEALHGAVPRTQAAMTEGAGNELKLAVDSLAATLREVATLGGINVDALHALQDSWTKWADAQANLVASQVEGGSMEPMIWANEKTTLILERIEQLNRLKDGWTS